ncbi:MAG TPA: hypothetical protein VJM11_00215 [Nevskiaceae bacterium]|nr:hypothetical protein [Nevskiaceae bacterium]
MSQRLMKAVSAVMLGTGMTFFSGALLAGEVCDPKKEKCDAPAACSPGYFKNHLNKWCNTACPTGTVITECDGFVTMLNWTGPKPGQVKNEAASILNEVCYGTAEASPCEEE